MRINAKFPPVYPICINLKERKAKRKWMIKQAKKQNIKINFFTAELHQNPKRGCLESHLSVIEKAIADGSGKQKVAGVFQKTDVINHKGITRTNGLYNVAKLQLEAGTATDPGTRLYLSSTEAGKFTDKISSIPVGRIVTKDAYPSYPDYILLNISVNFFMV